MIKAAVLFIFCITGLGTFGDVARPPGDGADPAVPAFVRLAAAAEPIDFLQALAVSKIPAGLVSLRQKSGDVSRAWHLEAGESRTRLSECLGVFRATHPDYAVRSQDGFLLLSDQQKNDTRLTRVLSSLNLEAVPAVEAVGQVVSQIAQQPTTGGRVGSILGRPGDPEPSQDSIYGPPVTLHLTNSTVLDCLIAIARGAPGTAWAVTSEASLSGGRSQLIVKVLTSSGRIHTFGPLE